MKKTLLLGLLAVASLYSAAPTQATLILSPGLVGGSGDVDNVIFNACGLGAQLGTTIQGCLNSDHTQLVNFTSNELIREDAGGQAVIIADDGAFDFLQINFANPTVGFDKLQFNIDALVDGTASFIGVDQFGTLFDFGSFAIDGSGANQFTLGSIDGQVAVSFTIQSTVPIQGISDLTQVRLGSAAAGQCPNGAPTFPICVGQQEVPEPMSMAVLGVGLVALGAVRMRRRSKA